MADGFVIVPNIPPAVTRDGRRIVVTLDNAYVAEKARQAVLLGLAFDAYTNIFRPLSPGGQKYKYSGCLRADTLEPLGKGVVKHIEQKFGFGNTVSDIRRGFANG